MYSAVATCRTCVQRIWQGHFVTWCVQASGERLVWVSRIMVFVWAVVMGCAMSVAQVAGINVNFLITIIGAPQSPSHAGSSPACRWGRGALATAMQCTCRRAHHRHCERRRVAQVSSWEALSPRWRAR